MSAHLTADDIRKLEALLSESHAIDEKIADRGPIKLLPRPIDEIPNVPVLRARQAAILVELAVVRNYKVAKGHDLDGGGSATHPITGKPHYDLAAIGWVEAVTHITKGTDRALPEASTLLRVRFSSGDHLWFDAKDLKHAPKSHAKPEAPKP